EQIARAFRAGVASRLRKTVGLEARAREQSVVPNPGGCVLLIARRFAEIVAVALFALRLPQLVLCHVDFSLRLLAKKNPAELIPMIVSGDELFLRVRSIKVHARRRQREIANEIHPQIKHLRPKIGDLLVTDAFLARHISPCYQTLLTAVFPVGLTAHTAHDSVRVKGEITNGVNSFFFSLEIFGDRRPVRPGLWSISYKVEIQFCA